MEKKNGKLSGWHPADLGAKVLDELVYQTGIDPKDIDDVIFGCVDQVGAQSGNLARNAVLATLLLPPRAFAHRREVLAPPRVRGEEARSQLVPPCVLRGFRVERLFDSALGLGLRLLEATPFLLRPRRLALAPLLLPPKLLLPHPVLQRLALELLVRRPALLRLPRRLGRRLRRRLLRLRGRRPPSLRLRQTLAERGFLILRLERVVKRNLLNLSRLLARLSHNRADAPRS